MMRLKTPSTGRLLQLALALAVTIVAALPFYRGEGGALVWGWLFLAIVVGALVGHPLALILAVAPFELGANLGRWAQGPVLPGHGIYPGYEFGVTRIIAAIIGGVGILLGLLLRAWWRTQDWARVVPALVILLLLTAVSGKGMFREFFPPTVAFTLQDDAAQGYMLALNATGSQGTSARAQASPLAGVSADGMTAPCVPRQGSVWPTHFTVRGERFKPGEDVRIDGEYVAADCTVLILAGDARADANGAFTVAIRAAPDRGPAPD